MLDATLGADVGAPYAAEQPLRPYIQEVATEPAQLRVAFTTKSLMGRNVHADCHTAVHDAAKLLESLGHHVEEAAPPIERERFNRAFILLVAGETRADLEDARELLGRAARCDDVEYTTWVLALVGKATSASEYASARSGPFLSSTTCCLRQPWRRHRSRTALCSRLPRSVSCCARWDACAVVA